MTVEVERNTQNINDFHSEKKSLDSEKSNDDKNEAGARPSYTLYKLTRLFVLLLLWIMTGAYFEIIGPVVPELIAQTNSDYENVLRAVSMRGAGHVLGAILGGLMVDRWYSYIDLMLAISALLMMVTGVIAAYVCSITWLFIILFLQGNIETFINTAVNRMIFVIFKEHSAAPITVAQLGYQMGSITAPLLVRPFLDARFSGVYYTLGKREVVETLVSNSTTTTTTTEGPIVPHYPANFVNAFWIITVLGAVVFVACLALFIYDQKKTAKGGESQRDKATTQTIRESVSLKNCSADHPYYALTLLVLLFCFIACIFSIARVYSKVIFSYTRDGPGFSVEDSSLMNSSFFISSAIGILIFIIPLLFIHVKYIIQVTIVLAVSIGLYYLYTKIIWLWILYISLGFFMGVTISAGVAFVNRYIEFTAPAQMAPQFGAAFGDVIVMYAVSWSYQNYGPYTIWNHLLWITTIMFAVTCAMQIVAMLKGDRFQNRENQEEDEHLSLLKSDNH